MLRRLVLVAAASAATGVNGAAAGSQPTVAQIKAAVAAHSDAFVLANSFSFRGGAPGHGWIDVETGAGRWVLPNGKLGSLETVTPEPHHPTLVVVAKTKVNYTTRTWYRTKREESAKAARPAIIDPIAGAGKGVQFRLLGVERVDARQTFHLRSTYFPYLDGPARLDVWFSTDQDYLIRFTTTTKTGDVVQRVDNRWLPRTPANLALLTMPIPNGFKQVFVSS